MPGLRSGEGFFNDAAKSGYDKLFVLRIGAHPTCPHTLNLAPIFHEMCPLGRFPGFAGVPGETALLVGLFEGGVV
jgi:hypothetical protein